MGKIARSRIGRFGLMLCAVLWNVSAVRAQEPVSMTIDTAVETALRENLGLQLDRLDIDTAQGARTAAEGAFDAALTASASGAEKKEQSASALFGTEESLYDWNAALSKNFESGTGVELEWNNNRSESNSSFSSINPAYRSTLELNVSQALLKGRGIDRQTYGIQAADRELKAAHYRVNDQTAELAAEVKQAYWELVFAIEDVDVRKLSLRLAEAFRDESREKIKAGVLAPVEIHEPEAEVARREELLIRGTRNVGSTEDALKLLLNVSDWSVPIRPADRPDLPETLPEFEEALANALANRDDIKAAEQQLVAARYLRLQAEDAKRPDLALVGGAGLNGLGEDYGNSLDGFTGGDYYMWSVGLRFQMPIENRAAKGQFLQTRSVEEKARVRAEFLRQEIMRSVREAVRDVRLATKAVQAARKSSVAFEKQLEAEKSKFDVGLTTTNDVLRAQEQFAQALSRERRALTDLAISQARLDRVQGFVGVKMAAVSTPEPSDKTP